MTSISLFRMNVTAARLDAASRAVARARSMGVAVYWIAADFASIVIDGVDSDGRNCCLTFTPTGDLVSTVHQSAALVQA